MNQKQNERETRRREEDAALNRGLAWIGVGIVLELLLLLVRRYYLNVYTTAESVNIALAFHSGLKVCRVIGLAGAVVCIVWAWLSWNKGSRSAFPGSLCVLCAVLAFISHVTMVFRDSGVRMLLMLVPACAGLALAFYLYQREFFWSGVFTGMGVVALWMIRHRGPGTVNVYLAVLYAVLGCALIVLIANRQGKTLKVGTLELRLLPRGAAWQPIGITVIANALAVLAALMSNITVAYYLIYVLAAWLFGLLVYYTVKML